MTTPTLTAKDWYESEAAFAEAERRCWDGYLEFTGFLLGDAPDREAVVERFTDLLAARLFKHPSSLRLEPGFPAFFDSAISNEMTEIADEWEDTGGTQ